MKILQNKQIITNLAPKKFTYNIFEVDVDGQKTMLYIETTALSS